VCGAAHAIEEAAIEREAPATIAEPPEKTARMRKAKASPARIVESAEVAPEPEPPAAEPALMDSEDQELNGGSAPQPAVLAQWEIPETEALDAEEDEPAEVIGFALPASARRPDAEDVAPAAAATVNVTDGTSALDPAPVSRVKEMPRPSASRKRQAARPAESAPVQPEPEWRQEVSRRLEDYRAKRRRNGRLAAQTRTAIEDLSQPGLPFAEVPEADESGQAEYDASSRAPFVQPITEEPPQGEEFLPSPVAVLEEAGIAAPEAPARTIEPEHIEIAVPQPRFDFVLIEEDDVHPHSALVPVADLRERSRATALDALFLAIAYGGFLILFRALGGQISFGRQEALVYLATFFLIYAVYFGLFTLCGGATPGMFFRGLSVVSFDGRAPETGQLFRRAFGYVVSGGTLLLGFLWALWDEDRLTWHDRMSQTYLTRATAPLWNDLNDEEPPEDASAFSSPPPGIPPAT
jgi:uncharacterized RDD family membrane protein YckC